MIIQGSGTLSSLSLYDMYENLQTQESTVLANLTKNGGPLALYNSTQANISTASQNYIRSIPPVQKQEDNHIPT